MDEEEKIEQSYESEIADETKPNKKRFNFDRSDLISVLAVLLSLGAFGVSIIQADIMKEQQRIMSSQQKSSVLPYLIPKADLKTKTVKEFTTKDYNLTITNKGFGPALVNEIKITCNNVEYNDSYKLLFDIIELSKNVSMQGMEVGDFNDVFISPGESYNLLSLKMDHEENQKVDFLKSIKLEFNFCSILEDCWEHKNGEAKKIN